MKLKMTEELLSSTRHIHPIKEMSMTTPMNCVKRMSGVKKDHTGHRAMLRLQGKAQTHAHFLICIPS